MNGSLQEGVNSATSWQVTQRLAGANLSVDIAANVDLAYVTGDSVSLQGLYPVAPHSVAINETVSTAHATLPRVDMVVLEVLDHVHDASGENLSRVRVLSGTATSGATLANRTGAASLPDSCLLLADVLVGAGVTSITNSVIRDRRKWARGAYCRIVRNANAAAGNDYTTSSSTIALLDGTNLVPRIECSGVPLRVRLLGVIDTASASSGVNVYFSPQVDSAGVDGMPGIGASPISQALTHATFLNAAPAFQWTFVPVAGSHVIAPAWACPGDTATAYANANRPFVWEVQEIVRQNAQNNATSG